LWHLFVSYSNTWDVDICHVGNDFMSSIHVRYLSRGTNENSHTGNAVILVASLMLEREKWERLSIVAFSFVNRVY
jgi:hypothetical protein